MGCRTLIEIEGGIFIPGGGRHSRGTGYAKDAEKYLEAVLAGWTVIRLTGKQLELDFIERIVAMVSHCCASLLPIPQKSPGKPNACSD